MARLAAEGSGHPDMRMAAVLGLTSRSVPVPSGPLPAARRITCLPWEDGTEAWEDKLQLRSSSMTSPA